MAYPPANYIYVEGGYFTPKGAGPAAWDGSAMAPTLTDVAPPAGYSLLAGGYFTADGQGPYRWDGSAMALI